MVESGMIDEIEAVRRMSIDDDESILSTQNQYLKSFDDEDVEVSENSDESCVSSDEGEEETIEIEESQREDDDDDDKSSPEFAIPKTSFHRFVNDILNSLRTTKKYRLTSDALEALQTAAEDVLIETFRGSEMIANAGQKITLSIDHLQALSDIDFQ